MSDTTKDAVPLSDEQIIQAFESEIENDPDAYNRPGEVIYQITHKELIRVGRQLLSASKPAEQEPIGWVGLNNYWTQDAKIAERMGNLTPVYLDPAAPAQSGEAVVAWAAYNGVSIEAFFKTEGKAKEYATEMQKSHDLSGSLAAFHVKPLYTSPYPVAQPASKASDRKLPGIAEFIANQKDIDADCVAVVDQMLAELPVAQPAPPRVTDDHIKALEATAALTAETESAMAEREKQRNARRAQPVEQTRELTDEQRDQLEVIDRCDPSFLIRHIEEDTAYDGPLVERVFELAKERARALLTAARPASGETE